MRLSHPGSLWEPAPALPLDGSLKMEDLVQKITIRLKATLSAPSNGLDASKVIEEQVLALVRSGQVIEVRQRLASRGLCGFPRLEQSNIACWAP